MISRKTRLVPIVFASMGLIFTIFGMFKGPQSLIMMGVVCWGASILSSRFIKKRLEKKEET
jgi:hypothetical protein